MRPAAAARPSVLRVAILCATTVCATSACAASRAAGPRTAGEMAPLASVAGPPSAPSVAFATRSLIPRAALDIDPWLSLHEVVGRYWPQLLRPPQRLLAAPDPRGDVLGVYIDGNFAGGQESLRGIRAGAVRSLARLSQSEEHARFGRAHAGGGVIVTFR